MLRDTTNGGTVDKFGFEDTSFSKYKSIQNHLNLVWNKYSYLIIEEIYIDIVTTKDGVVGIKLVLSPWASLNKNQSPVRRPVWLRYAASWASS